MADMVSRIQQKLLDHVDEHYLSCINRWQDLYTQLYTLTMQKMQEIVITWLQRSGMSVQFLASDRSLLYGELQVGAEQTLLLYLRVPELPSASAASYVTTALISYQSALDTCFFVLDSLRVNIKLVFDGWIKQHDFCGAISNRTEYGNLLHADRCIWYTSEQKTFTTNNFPLLALGTKGALDVELTVQTANAPVEAQYGAIAPNAAWQLLWALAAVKDRREDILIEGFYDALLPIEDDVIEALAHLADSFPSLFQSWALPEPFLGLQGLQQYCAYFLTPTCTVRYIHGGQLAKGYQDFIPHTASAQLDFQLVPGQDPVDIYARLQNHLINQSHMAIQTQLLRAIRPAHTLLSDPFVKFVIQATTTTYGRAPGILPLIAPGVTSHLLQELALPFVIIPLPFVITEPQEFYSRDHKKSLMQHIKQETIIMAGATFTSEKE